MMVNSLHFPRALPALLWSGVRSNGQGEDGLASDQTVWSGIKATAAWRSGATSKGERPRPPFRPRRGKRRTRPYRAAYPERNVVERLINRLEQWRLRKARDQRPRHADRRRYPALVVR